MSTPVEVQVAKQQKSRSGWESGKGGREREEVSFQPLCLQCQSLLAQNEKSNCGTNRDAFILVLYTNACSVATEMSDRIFLYL